MANTTNWLNISATSGSSGETILTLSANKNLSLYDKRAEITAYNPVYNISAKTYVTIQSFAPIIELSPAIIGVPDTGGTFELNISANCAWVISFPDLVSSYSTSAGTGNATVTLTVPGTSADTTLVGNIVVTAEGGQMSKTARIEQYGQGVQLSVSHSEILFPDSGAVRYFTVTANCVYDVSVVSGDWAVVSPQSGYTGVSSFTVTVDGTNTGTTTREGIVRISAPGVTRYIMLYQNPKETRLTAYYNATSTTDPTELYEVGTGFSKAETPDGTVIPGDSYIFPDTGSNRVFFTMTGTSIPANTFSGMSALTSVVIPDNITAIGQGAFRDCVNLTSVTIPDTVTVLPDNCFSGCSSLTAIPISESVTYIGEGCFAGCTGIETVTIPTGVTGIGAGCFSGSGVETIYANSPTPATIGNGAFTSGNLQDIIVPCAFFDAYKTAWSAYEEYMSCQDDEQLYFTTDTSNVKGTGETRTITILNTNIIQNRIGLTLPSDFPSQGAYVVDGNVIYLTYPANPSSTSTRTWTITVRATTKSGKDLSGSYRITQNANVVYSIPYTADTSTVTKSGETRTITIDTSGLVESSITISVEGATGVTTTYQNGTITVVFPYNSETNDKNIMIGVTARTTNDSVAAANINYTQRGGEIIYVIPYTADTSFIENTGETRTITIDTSGLVESSITISVEGATGVTTSHSNNTITLVFPSNAEQGRAITVTVHMRPIQGDDAYAVIHYYQDGINAKGEYFSFKIETDGVIKWCAEYAQHPESAIVRTIQYRINNSEWSDYTSSRGGTALPVSKGDIVEFRGNNSYYSETRLNYSTFSGTTCKFSVFGNIMSLINSTNFQSLESLSEIYTFNALFYGTSNLLDASKLVLPATSLKSHCYYSMFERCTSLVSGPTILPALTLADNCYSYMFYGCTSLTQAPVLPSTNLSGGSGCYFSMFQNCTSLTTAPELPATTLANDCYHSMFSGCTSLITAPALPATYIPEQAYRYMYTKCTSLVKAPDILATSRIQPTSDNWTLASMFQGCSNLNYLKCMLPEGNNGVGSGFSDWLKGVSATGTFVAPSSANWTTGANGIPAGWTRVDA